MPLQQPVDLLVLDIGGARCALPLTTVREVLRAVLITPLPGAPAVVEGVIGVRGEAVPVYDLRLRFGRRPRPLHPDHRLVLVWTGTRLAALRCDGADDIVHLQEADLVEAPAFRHEQRLVAGVARLPDGIAVIHDPAAFLEEAEELELERALADLAEAES